MNQGPMQVGEQIATPAETADPSIVNRASAFYAKHLTLVNLTARESVCVGALDQGTFICYEEEL